MHQFFKYTLSSISIISCAMAMEGELTRPDLKVEFCERSRTLRVINRENGVGHYTLDHGGYVLSVDWGHGFSSLRRNSAPAVITTYDPDQALSREYSRFRFDAFGDLESLSAESDSSEHCKSFSDMEPFSEDWYDYLEKLAETEGGAKAAIAEYKKAQEQAEEVEREAVKAENAAIAEALAEKYSDIDYGVAEHALRKSKGRHHQANQKRGKNWKFRKATILEESLDVVVPAPEAEAPINKVELTKSRRIKHPAKGEMKIHFTDISTAATPHVDKVRHCASHRLDHSRRPYVTLSHREPTFLTERASFSNAVFLPRTAISALTLLPHFFPAPLSFSPYSPPTLLAIGGIQR